MIVGLLAGNGLHAALDTYFLLDVVEDSLNLGSVGARCDNEIIGERPQSPTLITMMSVALRSSAARAAISAHSREDVSSTLYSPLLFLRLGTVVPVPNRDRIITDRLCRHEPDRTCPLQHRIEQLFQAHGANLLIQALVFSYVMRGLDLVSHKHDHIKRRHA